jgi:HAD superfamily hydrolase (TIGR01450 family)
MLEIAPGRTGKTIIVKLDLDSFDAVLLDLDGTIYHEEHPLPGAMELLARLGASGRKFACLSNSTTSPQRIVARLARMGANLDATQVYTAGAAAADWVLGNLGALPRVYNLATEGVHELLDGKVRWVSSADQACDVVVAGAPVNLFATEDRQLVALALLRRGGCRLLGMCADRVYPSPRGIEFGSGAFTSFLAYAAAVAPLFTGKPERVFFLELCRRLEVDPARCVLIGDNLESDIGGGRRIGMRTILTLTGVASRQEALSLPAQLAPDEIIEDLTALRPAAP